MSGASYYIKLSWALFKLNWTAIFLQLQEAFCHASTVAKYCTLFSHRQLWWALCYRYILVEITLFTYKSYFEKSSLSLIFIILSSHAKLTWVLFNKYLILWRLSALYFSGLLPPIYSMSSMLPEHWHRTQVVSPHKNSWQKYMNAIFQNQQWKPLLMELT